VDDRDCDERILSQVKMPCVPPPISKSDDAAEHYGRPGHRAYDDGEQERQPLWRVAAQQRRHVGLLEGEEEVRHCEIAADHWEECAQVGDAKGERHEDQEEGGGERERELQSEARVSASK